MYLLRPTILYCAAATLAITSVQSVARGESDPLRGVDASRAARTEKKTYASASGVFTLTVEPEKPAIDDGIAYGGAFYRFLKDGQEVWSAKKAYTLSGVVVTNDGSVVGVGYTSNQPSPEIQVDRNRYLHIVILDLGGKDVAYYPKKQGRGIQHRPWPYVKHLLVAEDIQRVCLWGVPPVRLSRKPKASEKSSRRSAREAEFWVGVSGSGDSLWILDLVTGDLIARFDPQEVWRTPTEATGWNRRGGGVNILELRRVLGTPLILVHCEVTKAKPWSLGALFALVDFNGKQVWSWYLPDSYTELFRRIRAKFEDFPGGSAILGVNEPGRFAVRLVPENICVEFAVSANDAGEWVVAETARGDCDKFDGRKAWKR